MTATTADATAAKIIGNVADATAASITVASGTTYVGPTILDIVEAVYGEAVTLTWPKRGPVAFVDHPTAGRIDRITAATGPIAHGI